jgi:phosphonopyruvate decarboxylase
LNHLNKRLDNSRIFGVPDSLLKNLTAIIPNEKQVITPNEGSSIAMAAGYHMATGKTPLIYLQNSGIGNFVNPWLSLAHQDVYSIPMILLIGWRGEPDIHDEPQHIVQGRLSENILESIDLPYQVLPKDKESADAAIDIALKHVNQNQSPYAFLVSKGTFSSPDTDSMEMVEKEASNLPQRFEVLEELVPQLKEDDIIVSTTGFTSRELYQFRVNNKMPHDQDFYTVGSMGHTSAIASGLALGMSDSNIKKRVVCIDGDGSLLMHMGNMTSIAALKESNIVHILLNNGTHESVGNHNTNALDVNFAPIAESLGYDNSISVDEANWKSSLKESLGQINNTTGTSFVQINTETGVIDDLGRPKHKPVDAKSLFMAQIKK